MKAGDEVGVAGAATTCRLPVTASCPLHFILSSDLKHSPFTASSSWFPSLLPSLPLPLRFPPNLSSFPPPMSKHSGFP